MADCLYYIDVNGKKVGLTEEELVAHLSEPDETGISPFDQFVKDKTLDLSQIKEPYALQVRRPKKEVSRAVSAGQDITQGGERVRSSEQGPKVTKQTEGNEEVIKMRSLYKQLISRSTGLSEAQKSILENDPNALYTTLPVAQVREFALSLIKGMGVEESVKEASNLYNGMQPVERTMVLGAAMDYYSKLANEQQLLGNEKAVVDAAQKELDANEKLKEVTSKLGELGTAYGRAINIFKEIYKLSNIALVQKLEKNIAEINKTRAQEALTQVGKIRSVLQENKSDIQQAAKDITEAQLEIESSDETKAAKLSEEVARLKKEILERDKAQKGTKKNPLKIQRITNDTEYDKRLKDFMQRTRSIASKDDLVDLTYFGLYHIENGLTKFADWYNVMSKKFKGFSKDLKNVYASVRDKAIENGADKSLFSTDDEAASFMSELQKESDAKKLITASKLAAIAEIKKQEKNNPEKARALAPRLAAERIRKDAESNLNTPATAEEQDYLKKMVKMINQKAKEYYAEKKQNIKNVNDILSFAIANNKSDYALWEKTQAELEDVIDSNENLTEERKEEIKEFLDDYMNSIFDTFLTKNQISDVIREKLIDAGFYTEKVINNKSVKSVNWSKIIGNASNIAEAKEKLTKSILDLGFTLEQAKPEINAILDQFDSKIADIKTKEVNKIINKGIVNKVKSALGEKVGKTKISRLIELNNKGILSDEKIKEGLAKELGLITLSKEDIAQMRELSSIIDNPNIPYFMKRQFEEKLQYIMDTKGGNIDYLENRESVMANKLSSVYNQIQNSTGFFRSISTLFTVAAKTGKPLVAAKVFGKEFANSIADAITILNGRVSRGSSFADLTKVTEGEARVRYLEQGKGKLWGGKILGKPLYAQLGGKKVDLNPLNAAYSKVKYIQRLLEAVDTLSSATVSGLTQFWQINKQINTFYPELSSKEKAQKVYDIMYSLDREVEAGKAIESLKAAGVTNPTQFEINRTINERVERARNEEMSKEFYKTIESLKPMAEQKLKLDGNENPTSEQIQNEAYRMIGGTEPLDIVARGERQAGRETGKVTTVGITSIILMPMDAVQSYINKQVKTSKSKLGTSIANAGDIAFTQTFPFVHSIGRWTEMQLELTPYGAIKGAAYKAFAKISTQEEGAKISNQEYSELGDDYIIRSVLGLSYTAALMYGVAMVKNLAGDDDDAEDAIFGVAKAEKYTQERVRSIGKPKETVKIGGKYIPLDLLGNEGRVLGMYADYLTLKNKTPEMEDRSKIYIGALAVLNSTVDAAWTSNASKYGGMFSAMFKGKEEKYAPQLGKIAGGILGSQIPFNRTQTEMATLLNPKTRQSVDFGTNVLNQMSITKAFSKGKPSFDYRGRNYDYGDIYANSADGVVKMFSKGKYGDEIDAFLSEINFAATDAFQNPKEIEGYKFAILNKDGTQRAMTSEEYYDFRLRTANKFNALISANYKSMTQEEISDNPEATMELRRVLASKQLQDAKLEAFGEVQEATGFSDPYYLKEMAKQKKKIQEKIEKIKKYY